MIATKKSKVAGKVTQLLVKSDARIANHNVHAIGRLLANLLEPTKVAVNVANQNVVGLVHIVYYAAGAEFPTDCPNLLVVVHVIGAQALEQLDSFLIDFVGDQVIVCRNIVGKMLKLLFVG